MNTTFKREALRVVPAVWADHGRRAIETAPFDLDRVGWRRGLPWRFPEKFDLSSVCTSIAFVHAMPIARVSVPRLSSYRLKHIAEQWGGRVGLSGYIMNGDFICAALYCGVALGTPRGANCAVGLILEEGA